MEIERLTLTPEHMRFISKVDVMPSGCWEFGGAQSQKYGTLKVKGKQVKAHRYSFELAHKESAEGLFVCHHCDNPRCVNPNHLFLGTASDNTRDCWNKGRNHDLTQYRHTGADSGPARHPESYRGSKNGRAVLTEAQVQEIKTRYAAGGISQTKLAAEYGVAQTTISAVIQGKNWRWECWSSLGEDATCDYRKVL